MLCKHCRTKFLSTRLQTRQCHKRLWGKNETFYNLLENYRKKKCLTQKSWNTILEGKICNNFQEFKSSTAQTGLFYHVVKRSERDCPGEHDPDFYLHLACVDVPTSSSTFCCWDRLRTLCNPTDVFCLNELLRDGSSACWTHPHYDHISSGCTVLGQKCPNSSQSDYLSALTHVLFVTHSYPCLWTFPKILSLGMLSGNQRLFSLSSLGSLNLIMAILLFLYEYPT